MKRITSLLLILAICLCSCLVKTEKEAPAAEVIHISEPVAELRYTVAFRRADSDLAYVFDYVLGEVLSDGTAAKMCEVHIGEDMTDKEPISDKIKKKGDGSVERIEEAGKLVIGYNKQNAPLSWVDSSQKAVGFEMELAREVGRRMGINVEFKVLDWSRAESNLDNGEVDAIMSALVYTEDRAERFNLTRTYFTTPLVIISRKDDPVDDLSQLTGEKVAVSKGSYAEIFITEKGGATVNSYSSLANAYERVKNKNSLAMLADMTYVRYLEKGYK